MISKLILCNNIKIDKNYINVLDFSESEMLELVNANKTAETNSASFINYTDNKINVDFGYNTCINSTYIAFQNPLYSNKWFFAWVEDVEFRSEKNSIITFKVDVWSTWHNLINYKPCYVSREHVNDDTVGLHTIDENLRVNEFICQGQQSSIEYSGDGYVCIQTTYNPGTDTDFVGTGLYNGTFSAGFFFVLPKSVNAVKQFYIFLQATAYKGKAESVKSFFFIPECMIDSTHLIPVDIDIPGFYQKTTVFQIPFSESIRKFKTEIADTMSYTPKNNKCRCYPYHFLRISNNVGTENIYKYELFEKNQNNLIEFEDQLTLTIGMSGRLIPLNYKNIYKNYDESMELGKYPTYNWSSDEYINWLTQNAVNIPLGIATGTVSSATKMAGSELESAAGMTTGLSIAGMIGNVIGQFYSASLLSNKLAGSNVGDISACSNTIRYEFYNVRAKDDDMKIIDDYFTRFGYQVNTTKIPNIRGRRNYNYVQIAQSEQLGYGNIPSKYLDIINQSARRGITIWHNHENLGNFNVDNSII